jgi:hypothetical protein
MDGTLDAFTMNLGHNILDSITPPEKRAVVNRH